MRGVAQSLQAAERACVAAALLRPELFAEAGVARGDFFDPRLGDIWGAMEALHAEEHPIDIATVASTCRHSDLVLEVAAAAPTGENIGYYGRVVRHEALDRRLRAELDAIVRDAGTRGPELQAAAQALLDRTQASTGQHGVELRDGLLRSLNAIEQRYHDGGRPLGVTTGLAELDRLTSGLPRGVPFILGGRPGDGKSALALSIAVGAAERGAVVDYISLEDTAEVVRERALAQRSGLNLMAVRTGALRAAEWQRLEQAAGELAQRYEDRGGPGRILVIDDLPRRVEDLVQVIERSAARRNTDLVVVDYFQMLRAPSQRTRSRNDELSFCMAELTRIARRCRLALVICAQLRRDVEDATQPRLGHLKDCGQIEQDARGALLLQRRHGLVDGYGAPLHHVASAWLEKNSNGPAPEVFPLHWNAASVRYADASDAEEQAWRSAMTERAQKARRR